MEQKQKQICSSDRLPPLSDPWLVAQNLEPDDHVFYTVHDPLARYRCRTPPELLGRYIRACFHGWVILSNMPDGAKWYLWNPLTSKLVHLPRLIHKDGVSNDILECCLPSPPDEPRSILLLTRFSKPNLVFCRLDRKRKTKNWTEMSYSKQLKSITHGRHGFLIQLTCSNGGKVYALTDDYSCVVHVDIVVQEKQVVISMLPFVRLPFPIVTRWHLNGYLKGSCSELFAISVYLTMAKKPVDVLLYKLDMTSMAWVKLKDLKGTLFFVDTASGPSVTCSPAIASELGGGYIHILHETGKVIYSYNFKDKTICLSSLDLPPRSEGTHISVWAMPEFRSQGDDKETDCKADCKQDSGSTRNDEIELSSKTNEAYVLNIPFHVLEMIMEFCVGIEYLNFRATCKRCRSAAPVIQWRNATARKRLETYSLGSPWLMTFEKDRGLITFTDPMFGDNYFMKASQELFFDNIILCCRYGWLLVFTGHHRLVFFNPFTGDTRELPPAPHAQSFCFSEPPTSPYCMVVGFMRYCIYIHYAEVPGSFWYRYDLDLGQRKFLVGFPTFYVDDVYVLSQKGGLQVFKDDDLTFSSVIDEAPISCCNGSREYFLMACDRHLLLVIVGEFGESVEVFELNDCTREWEKMDGLGRHVIYIHDRMCLCMDARTREMENKIYFPRLHSKNGKVVFYSMETRRYHTFNSGNVEESFEDFFVTKQVARVHAWIEPNWSCR